MREDVKIYLDQAATTRVYPQVVEAMLPYFTEEYGNASTVYRLAEEPKNALRRTRETIARMLGCTGSEIYFTGGGSESDNWALIGIADAYRDKGKHIITTAIEHHGILNTCKWLEEHGMEVTYLPVDEAGRISLSDLEAAIRPDTILISVMLANNEIGTIEPVRQIGAIARAHGILFHTDGVQAFGQIPIDVEGMQIDLLSASAHKFHGPKGVGFLYIRNGVKIHSYLHGGGQERGRRAGTENVPGIVGMGTAARMAEEKMGENSIKEIALRDHMMKRILEEIPYSRVNGSLTDRLPGNVNVSFQFVQGETLLILLDMEGICASAGSACTSGSVEPSHVLTAIGLPESLARGSLRFTIGGENTMEEIDLVVDRLKEMVERVRSLSPEYEEYMAGGRERQ
jgi:cysteine desulfurase